MNFVMTPIGEIHSPFTDVVRTSIQPARSTATGGVEVYAPHVPDFDVQLRTRAGWYETRSEE